MNCKKEKEILRTLETQARKFGIAPRLIMALAMVESNLNCNFAFYEAAHNKILAPEFYSRILKIDFSTEVMFQKTSWGILGINGGLARMAGYGGWLPDLCNLDLGAEWGIRHLLNLQFTHGDPKEAIAAYEGHGSPMYVDIVMKWAHKYQSWGYI